MSSGETWARRARSHRAPDLLTRRDETLVVDARFQWDEESDQGHAYVFLLGSSGTEHCCQSASFDSAGAAAQLATLLNRFAHELHALETGTLPLLELEDWPDTEADDID